MNYVALSKQEMLFKIKKFLDSGSVAESGLDKFLFDSWQRSYYAEVDPYQTIPYVAYKIAAKGHKNHYTSFISVCQPVITQTFNIIKGSGFHLFLIDNDACLLESFPLTRTVIYNWSEESLGTNAAGTALATRKAVQINGSEHYCYGLHGYTTTAAPIFDDGGNLLGALCLIGPVNEDHSHVLSALAKAADKITDSLRIDKLNCQYFSVSQSLHKLIENITDGVLVLSGNGVIECVNPAAKDILGKNDTEIMGLHIFDLLSTVKSENLAVEEPFSDINTIKTELQKKYHCEINTQIIRNIRNDISNALIFMCKCSSPENRSRPSKTGFNNIMGKSKKLMDSIKIARIAAENMSNILLQGESGTGKDIFAQAIHNESPRRDGPFIAVNCGAIPQNLVSSELFGYVDGAFSGAKKGGAPGKFEAAAGGTLFLDEIGDMPLDSQAVLLRVLQERKITRVGDYKEIPVDIRVICATNRNLYEEVLAGNFREDLFYRINVISIFIPPLRERPEDITLLTRYFLSRMSVSSELITKIINSSLMNDLLDYQWPGNVRELQNTVERMVFLSEELENINLCDLMLINPSSCCNLCSAKCEEINYKSRKQQIITFDESNQIKSLLEKHGGNISQVAREMGYSRVTLYRKLKLYGIKE